MTVMGWLTLNYPLKCQVLSTNGLGSEVTVWLGIAEEAVQGN